MPLSARSSIVLTIVLSLGAAACSGSSPEPEVIASATDSDPSTATDPRSSATISTTTPSAPTTPSTEPADDASTTASSTGSSSTGASTSSSATDSSTTQSSTTASSTTASAPSTQASAPETAPAPVIPIRLRLDRRVDDGATEGFAALVRATLTDTRGWSRAGFEFTFDDTNFDYTVVLAEGPEVDSLCLPYDTFGRFSCQIGPTVALNADRWRTAVPTWPATLDEYRTMLVNHEVGHLIGQHHPASRCPGAGLPAPVMAQQSSGVDPCTANPWPLDWEITCARQGVEPLAPPYERDITLTCGPDGPITSG